MPSMSTTGFGVCIGLAGFSGISLVVFIILFIFWMRSNSLKGDHRIAESASQANEQALMKKLEEMQQQLDQRTDALNATDIYLNTADDYAAGDVAKLVGRLNAVVFQLAATMTLNFHVEMDNVVPLDDESEVVAKVARILGATFMKLLRKGSKNDQKFLLRTALQTSMVSFAETRVSSWISDANGSGDILSNIYAQLRETELQPVSARWKQLTRTTLRQMQDHETDLIPRLAAELRDILVVVGHREDPEKLKNRIMNRYPDRLRDILKFARDLNKQVGEGFTSCELEILYISPDTTFDTTKMDDVFQSVGTGRHESHKEKIICTTDLGLVHTVKTREGRKSSVLLKSKVVLPSTANLA